MVNARVNGVANHMVNHNSAYPTILSIVTQVRRSLLRGEFVPGEMRHTWLPATGLATGTGFATVMPVASSPGEIAVFFSITTRETLLDKSLPPRNWPAASVPLSTG